MKLVKGIVLLTTFILMVATPLSSIGAEDSPEKDQWQFGTEIYLWGASIGGELPTGTDIDIGFDAIIKNLNIAMMGTVAAKKDRWWLFADLIYMDIESGTNKRVLPASMASTEALARDMVFTVCKPIAGASKRRSWPGLLTFTTTAFSFDNCPPLRIVASVPSMASTARTVRSRTTTHWPISSRPSSFATLNPKWISSISGFRGRRLVRHPEGAHSSGR